MNNWTLYPLLLLFNPEFMQCVSKSQIEYVVPCKVLAASTKRCWSQARRVPLSQSGFTQWRDDGRLESHQSSDAAVFSSPSSYHHKVIANYFHQKVMSATIFTNLSSHQWTYWSYHHPLKLHVLNLSTSHQLKMRQLLKRDSIRVLNKSKKWCCKPKITTRNTISQNSK